MLRALAVVGVGGAMSLPRRPVSPQAPGDLDTNIRVSVRP